MIALPDPEQCPQCGSPASRVVNSRLLGSEVGCLRRRRQRECKACWHSWHTYESTLDPSIVHHRPKPAA